MQNNFKIYGVLGHPVAHSLSPVMHNAAFKAFKIAAEYQRFDITPEKLKIFCHAARKKYAGFSVTAPHKETIISFLDVIDPVAAEIGAVNTVVNQNGVLTGFNTDWIGVQKALAEVDAVLKNKTVLVFGAGGAARAVVYACICAGAHVIIVNRTQEKAIALAQKFGATVGTSANTARASIIINTVSAQASIFTKKNFHKKQIVMDCTYNPPETPFLKNAKMAGCKTINGLAMLLYQGEAQCALWTGEKAPHTAMKKALRSLKKNVAS